MKLTERWSAEDSAAYEDRRKAADARLDAWARWAGTHSPELIGFARCSSFARVMTPQDEEQQAGARHLKAECSDDEALEVDAILAGWKKTDPGYWKIVRQEYLRYGAQEAKARALGLNRTEYRSRLRQLQAELWRALDNGARNARKPAKLGSVPAKNARRRS
ncbi:MAG TPA: hypothetical protein PKC95_00370 [Thauera aminoaromatica]|nr:hypothetical protein [Thauera aminoaromatica]